MMMMMMMMMTMMMTPGEKPRHCDSRNSSLWGGLPSNH